MDELAVQSKARAFVAGVDTSDIHNDLSAYVSAVNAKVVEEALGIGESGYTITKPSGKHVITVNSLESVERQRFTICHEIAHIALDLASSHDEVPSWSYAKRHPNEVFCDTFAAELLMPYQRWLDLAPQGEPSIALIEHMASTFKTSFPASASRFASLTDMPCAFVTMDKGVIRYTVRSLSLRRINAWVSPRSPIPSDSVSYKLRSMGQSASETEEIAQDIWFNDWDKGLDLWEMSRHFHRSDTTIALLWFDAEDLPEVEVSRFGVRTVDDGGLAELTGELAWPSRRKRR